MAKSVDNDSTKAGVPAYRADKKAIAGYFPAEVWLQLKQLGVKLGGKNMQDLLGEALNRLFMAHGMEPIAPGADDLKPATKEPSGKKKKADLL